MIGERKNQKKKAEEKKEKKKKGVNYLIFSLLYRLLLCRRGHHSKAEYGRQDAGFC